MDVGVPLPVPVAVAVIGLLGLLSSRRDSQSGQIPGGMTMLARSGN